MNWQMPAFVFMEARLLSVEMCSYKTLDSIMN